MCELRKGISYLMELKFGQVKLSKQYDFVLKFRFIAARGI